LLSERVVAKHPVNETEEAFEQALKVARPAVDNYFDVVQKAFGVNPWSGTDLIDKAQRFAVKNVHASFEFFIELGKARNFADLLLIQSKFMNDQAAALSEQFKAIERMYVAAISEAVKSSPFQLSR
jgi:Phasin protein